MSKSARSQFIRSCNRRGNALILVAGVLVLLVIIATVFLSRTRTLRELGTAQRQGAFHRDRMESAASEIAQELADSLFVRTIDFTEAEYGLGVPPEEARRKAPDVSATRYGVDPDFAWNRAPWAVVPWTNPPDWLTWPLRPGKLRQMVNDPDVVVPEDLYAWRWIEDRQGGQVDLFNWPNAAESWPPTTEPYFNAVLQPRENPLGGPGVSDTRWLRDLEPQRMPVRTLATPGSEFSSLDNPFTDRHADAYSHWRHLSWIGRPGNGWRMCPDIADVTGVRSNIDDDGHRYSTNGGTDPEVSFDGRSYYGGVYQRNDVPIEQWPAMMPTSNHPNGETIPPHDESRLIRVSDLDEQKWGDSATSRFIPDDDEVQVPQGATDFADVARDTSLSFSSLDFWDRWLLWLRPEGYKQALDIARSDNYDESNDRYLQANGNLLPPNFYDLDDLDADGKRGEYYDRTTIPGEDDYDPNEDPRWGEAPSDEFRPGTARWHVSRILTDTDGDGFTDSFWWLSPHVGVDGTRQVIGVSVTDNSGRLNGNVATRFVKADDSSAMESTRGWTPADLALVSQNYAPIGSDEYAPTAAPVWNTGFFDIEAHQPALLETSWNESQNAHPDLTTPFVTYPAGGGGSGQGLSEAYQLWNSNNWRATSNRSLLEAVNIDAGSQPNPFFPDVYPFDISDRDNRLFYFRESGQEPQHPENIFTPFNLADELELRAYEGNNHGWIYSRLERALGPSTNGSDHILRGNLTRMETSEAAEQLDNRQLAHDLRHRLTFFNGARNETLPPHLWWEHRAPAPRVDDIVVGGDLPGTGLVAASDIRVEDMHERFNEQMREKIDLREWERASRSLPSFNTEYDPRTLSNRIGQGLMLGLTSGHVSDRDPGGNLIDPATGLDFIAQPATGQTIPLRGGRDSYFGAGDEAWEKTRRLAAAMTANMLASRDPDQTQPLVSLEGVVNGAPTPNQWHAELGAVPLPFFEGAYYPDNLAAHTDANNTGDIVFPGGETVSVGGSTDSDHLFGDWSYGGAGAGNGVSDHVDLSDISRPAATRPSPGIAELQPWSIVAVGIDDDGDGDADWVEKRPWCLSGDPRVVRRVRDIANVDDPTQPTVIEINGTDDNFDGFPDVPLGGVFQRIPAWDEVYASETHMLGMEPQPFISEVFFAEVAKPWMFPDGLICQNSDCMNAGSWYWIGNHTEREELTLFGAGDPAGPATIEGDDLPDIPRAIFALQLVNPYSNAIPLMRRNDDTGQLEPIYKLRFLTPNRFQSSTESTTWEIPLDPTELGVMRTSQEFMTRPAPGGGLESVPSFALDPTSDPIPMLPPATNDAPYSLMVVLNGMELASWRGGTHTDANGNERPSEVVQWLDFLDAEPSRHPSGHLVIDPEASANNQQDTYRTLQSGELIWRIDPARLATLATPIDPEQITKPTHWYREDVGSTGGFLGPTIDPNLGSMVELVRTHQSDIGSYTADVVIDRTAGLDGTDELLHVVGGQLPLHTIAAAEEIEDAFESGSGTSFVSFEPDMPEFAVEAGKPSLENYDIAYPKALQRRYQDPETGTITEANNVNALNGAGMNSLVELGETRPQWGALGVDPWDARWMQWGRYSRAWAVDDVDEQRTMETQPDTAIDGPGFDDVNESNRRLWRPDRAAPRFVAGAGRVTRSWSRDWANQLGLQPDPPAQYVAAPPANYDPAALDGQYFDLDAGGVVQWPPVVAAKTINGTDIDHGYRASYNSLWGLDLSTASLNVIGAGNPVLVGGNLPEFGPDLYQQADWTGADWAQPQLAWDRRWAEQKMGMASGAKLAVNQTIIDATGLENWDSWTVNDPDTNTRRRINLVVIGDPANDWDKNNDGVLDDIESRLPANSSMLTDTIDGGIGPVVVPPAIVPFSEDDGNLPAKWEFGWRGYGAPDTFAETAVTEHWDNYQSAMRFKHGNIINWKWDPDGIGRLEEGSGDEFPFLGSDNVSEDSYSEENPYPYPWATRNVRLPWSYSIHESEDADFDFDTDEYYLYEARKPTFFAFGHQRNVDGTVYDSDRGYNPNTQAVQSYPDKGFYGPAEIDGEILMPFGYQVQLKDANFEQVGEVLEVPTIAHELHMPMNQPVGGGFAFSWPADYYNQWPATPDLTQQALTQIQTIKTYSEALAEEIAAGAGKSAGHLQLGGTIDGPNAIVGDPRTTYEVVDGQLVIHEPYDLVSSDRIPDWYLAANDVSHIGPDLPAVQRLLDMFVVDGPGIYDVVESDPDDLYSFISPWSDGYIDDPEDWALYADPPTPGQLAARSANFDNAGGFEGRPTRGLVNINTASVEVLRSMPHMYRMVHGDPHGAATPLLDQVVSSNSGNPERPLSPHPRTAVPEAISQYRDGLGQIQQRFFRSDNDLDEPAEPADFDPLRDDTDEEHWSPFNELVPGVPNGAPYPDRGFGSPRDAWGFDNVPRTGDDAIPPIDPVFDDLAEDYNMGGLADTNADETVRYSRGTRGFAGIGELLQLTRPAYYDYGFANLDIDGQIDGIEDVDLREPLGTSVAADAWRIDWSGRNPFGWQDSQVNGPYGNASGGTTLYDNRSGFDSNGDRLRDALDNPGAFLSTDTDRYHDTQVPGLSDFEPVASWPANERWEDPLGGYGGFQHADTDDPRYRELHLTGDRVAGDAEEQSLLFSGISNLVTTRSDVFTVHLRVRTFRRNPETGVWDATDRSQIVDDSRYVMLVDRSEVDHPGDKPRIMLMQRIAD